MTTEEKFWQIIETAWAKVPTLHIIRAIAVKTNDKELLAELSQALSVQIVPHFKAELNKMNKNRLTQFIHFVERKLYQIDRQEIHEFTDGSDDGFLYCRCFILGMGEAYYKMVDENPSQATVELEAEDFGFTPYWLYEEKFGQEFERNTLHCIESCSNQSKWP